jgi:hypothetical protein
VSEPGAKPLAAKAYGSIAHLPGSRMGPGDHHCHEGQARIATLKPRDRHDVVIVQEKLDGSCCAVAKVNGEIIALGRAGYRAVTSQYRMHVLFHDWVLANWQRFDELLGEGERVVGEWLAQAHGTRYDLPGEPFAPFDLMVGPDRAPWEAVAWRTAIVGLETPHTVSVGPPVSIETALRLVGPRGHRGALETVEGAVWRVERGGKVDFLAKYVRPDKVDGLYLPERNGGVPIWNWQP